ncbi:MAG: hypothetical protein ACXV8O_21535 [Methylobacter sp.]
MTAAKSPAYFKTEEGAIAAPSFSVYDYSNTIPKFNDLTLQDKPRIPPINLPPTTFPLYLLIDLLWTNQR